MVHSSQDVYNYPTSYSHYPVYGGYDVNQRNYGSSGQSRTDSRTYGNTYDSSGNPSGDYLSGKVYTQQGKTYGKRHAEEVSTHRPTANPSYESHSSTDESHSFSRKTTVQITKSSNERTEKVENEQQDTEKSVSKRSNPYETGLQHSFGPREQEEPNGRGGDRQGVELRLILRSDYFKSPGIAKVTCSAEYENIYRK